MSNAEDAYRENSLELNDTILIHPSLRNSCFGYYSVPQCVGNCSMSETCEIDFQEMILATIASVNYWKSWLTKSETLIKKPRNYGKRWFDRYLNKIKSLLSRPLI